MSRDCTQIVWDLNLKPATLKFTLLSLADRADNVGYRCYPSIERIAKDTGLNKKTVQQNINKLIEIGLIKDTGKRVGPTQKVRVLQIDIKRSRNWNDTENGTLNDPKNGTLNDPKNGLQNQSFNQSMNQSDKNGSSNEQPYPHELVKEAFEYFWKHWKETKKAIGKTDTSPKDGTFEKKWKPLFNKQYFKKHTEDEFRAEVNAICEFVTDAHSLNGFNRFEHMQTGRLFSEKQWRDK